MSQRTEGAMGGPCGRGPAAGPSAVDLMTRATTVDSGLAALLGTLNVCLPEVETE